MNQPIRELSQSLADRVYFDLRQRVVAGDVPPGAVVQEAAIARATGASRTPVREALRRLEAEGLIMRSPLGTYSVTDLSAEELYDLYELRAMLEGYAARLAAQRRGRVELARLEDVVESMRQAVSDRNDELLTALNGAFHDLIADASRNRYLQTQIRSIREHYERYRMPALAVLGRRENALSEHVLLMAAVKDKDGDHAQALALAHVREALKTRVADSRGAGRDPEGVRMARVPEASI